MTWSVKVDDANAQAKVGSGPIGKVRLSNAKAAICQAIKEDTHNLIPMGDASYKPQGKVRNSVDLSQSRDGIIRWTSPATARLYYMARSRHFTTPGTGPQWVEQAKATHKDSWSEIGKRGLNG